MSEERFVVLVAEDSRFDQIVLTRAFAAAGLNAELHFVSNGEDLMAYLERTTTANADGDMQERRPDIVLLDLHMPRMDGRDAVRLIRQDERLKRLPLVILTSSDHEGHVRELYGLGVNSYVLKPNNFDALVTTVRQLNDYWFETVKLPKPK